MRIYFTADKHAELKLQRRFARIIELLHNVGVQVISNLAGPNLSGFNAQDLEKIEASGSSFVEQVDGLIIENTSTLAEGGFLIASALTHKKPIVCLLERGRSFDKNLLFLCQDPRVTKTLHLLHYTEATLEKTLLDFVHSLEHGEGNETPSIKFTLRITPRIERYLQWKTHNTKITKADYLRHLIEDLIDHDVNYQKSLKKK